MRWMMPDKGGSPALSAELIREEEKTSIRTEEARSTLNIQQTQLNKKRDQFNWEPQSAASLPCLARGDEQNVISLIIRLPMVCL